MFLPSGDGPFGVGVMELITDSSEYNVLSRIFYPTSKTVNLSNAPNWIPDPQYIDGFAGSMKGGWLATIILNRISQPVKLGASLNAEIASGSFPLVIFSHGLYGNRLCYSAITSMLASYGFIVACPEHRDGSSSMTWKLGDENTRTWIPYDSRKESFNFRNEQVNIRADECISLLNCLLSINKNCNFKSLNDHQINQLSGKIDETKLIIMGHSFGGATCVTSLAREPRFCLGLALDIWMFPVHESEYSKVNQPLLLLNNEYFHWGKNLKQLNRFMTESNGEKICISVKGTGHATQCDFPLVLPWVLARLFKMRYTMDPLTALELNIKACVAFIFRHFNIACNSTFIDILDCNHAAVFKGTNPPMTS